MKTYRCFYLGVLVMLIFTLGACSKNNDKDLAPDSLAGKMYQVVVNTGTGLFAATGTATLSFDAGGNYTTTGDANIVADNGTYTYTKVTDDTGEFQLASNVIPAFQATYVFTYTTEGAGNFTASLPATGDTQSGTFTEQ